MYGMTQEELMDHALSTLVQAIIHF